MSDEPRVTHDPGASRFTVTVDGATAELDYRLRAGRLILVHTEVPHAVEGHGVGGHLVAAAVDYAAVEGLVVVPLCPFARSWLEHHPDAAAGITVDWNAA